MAENKKVALGMLYGEEKSFTNRQNGDVVEYTEFTIVDDDGDDIRFNLKRDDKTTFKKFYKKVLDGRVVIEDNVQIRM